MKFLIDRQERYCTIALHEEKLNSLNAAQFKSELVMLNAEGVKNMIIDLGSTSFVDSSGLSSLLVGNRLCKQAGGSYVICGLSDNVTKLIKISQLDSILKITPSLAEGIELVLMEELERDIEGGSAED
jgi:anti-sigma B factor antagonist